MRVDATAHAIEERNPRSSAAIRFVCRRGRCLTRSAGKFPAVNHVDITMFSGSTAANQPLCELGITLGRQSTVSLTWPIWCSAPRGEEEAVASIVTVRDFTFDDPARCRPCFPSSLGRHHFQRPRTRPHHVRRRASARSKPTGCDWARTRTTSAMRTRCWGAGRRPRPSQNRRPRRFRLRPKDCRSRGPSLPRQTILSSCRAFYHWRVISRPPPRARPDRSTRQTTLPPGRAAAIGSTCATISSVVCRPVSIVPRSPGLISCSPPIGK